MTLKHMTLAALMGALQFTGGADLRAAEPKDPLMSAAEAIYEKAKGKYKTIGVLKFQVQKGDGRLDDNLGTINMSLARRLEMALIFAQKGDKGPPKPEDLVLIVKNASATVATADQAAPGEFAIDTADGRKRFFKLRYRPYWGTEKEVSADALIAGWATLSPDLKKTSVKLKWFDAAGIEDVGSFDLDNTVSDLVMTGQSFVTRDGAAGPKASFAAAADLARPEQDAGPFAPAAKPLVVLKIEYAGKAVPVKWKDGKGQIPDFEDTTQKVKFVLERGEAAKGRSLGVVLKVNGVNTLFREENPANAACSKWMLNDEYQKFEIVGFQESGTESKEFVLKTPREYQNSLKSKTMYYGKETGCIEMVVFQDVKDAAPKTPESPSPGTMTAILTAEHQGKDAHLPETWGEAKVALNRQPFQTKNLLAPGPGVPWEIKEVQFTAYPTPVMAATIRYWKTD